VKLTESLKDVLVESSTMRKIFSFSNEKHLLMFNSVAKMSGIEFDIDPDIEDNDARGIMLVKFDLHYPQDFINLGKKLKHLEDTFGISIGVHSIDNDDEDWSIRPSFVVSLLKI
jgi:hypothetical protein